MFREMDRTPFLLYDCWHGASDEVRLLAECANRTRWSDRRSVESFIGALTGKVPILELQKRLDIVDTLQPQPLAKIQRYLLTGVVEISQGEISAITKLTDIVDWIATSDRKPYRAIFLDFHNRIRELEDYFLCLPRTQVLNMVRRFPSLGLLPPALIHYSQFRLSNEALLALSPADLAAGIPTLCEGNLIDPDAVLEPFLSFDGLRKPLIGRMLLLAFVGFLRTEKRFVTLISSLERFLPLIDSSSVGLFLKVLQVLVDRRLCPSASLFGLLLAEIGTRLLVKRPLFATCFELIDFCKRLVKTCSEFRDFLAENLAFFDKITMLAFLAIANNALDIPRRGSTIMAVTTNCTVLSDTVECISDGTDVRLAELGTTLDLRNCTSLEVHSPSQFDPSCIEDMRPFVTFFETFAPTEAFEEALFLASLQDFLKAPGFREQFSVPSSLPVVAPQMFPSPVQEFLDFYVTRPTEKAPPFQLASQSHGSSIRRIWSVIVTDREEVYSSPLPIGIELAIELSFELPVMVTVLSALAQPSLWQHFGPFHVRSELALLLTDGRIEIGTDGCQIHRLSLFSSSCLLMLKIECTVAQLIKFRTARPEEHESLPIVFVTPAWKPFDISIFPRSSLFTDFLYNSLAGSVRNWLWKSVYLRLLPDLSVELNFLLHLVHALLCDTVPINEILKVDFTGIARPTIDLGVMLSRVDAPGLIDLFLEQLDAWVRDRARHGVWKDNPSAYPVAAGEPCRDCVVFGARALAVSAGPMDSPFDGIALPMQHLARSGIELVRLVRNTVAVAIAVGQIETLEKVQAIVQTGIKMGSVVLCSPCVHTVEDFITTLRK
jgi:hypothetical protein